MASTELLDRGTDLKKLTDRQRRFVQEYLICMDGAKAAIAAGYSPKCAAAQAGKLMRKRSIKRALGKALKEIDFGKQLTVENVLQELAYCVFRDPVDFCDENGRISIDDLRKLPPQVRRCIDGIKCRNTLDDEGKVVGQEVELKFVQKGAMIRLAMDYFNLLQPTINTQVFIDWDKRLAETMPQGQGRDDVSGSR